MTDHVRRMLDVIETSYADRAGKYMGQKGVGNLQRHLAFPFGLERGSR